MATEKKIKECLLLVDGENLLHRSFHKFANLKSHDGKPSGAIFGFFKSLHYVITRFSPTGVIITFDNGHSKVRTSVLPGYKGHRKNISIDYTSLQSQKKIIMKLLKYLRIPYVFDKDKKTLYEGDDFIAWINRITNSKVIIVSSDKDFNQLITKNTTLFNPSKDERVNLRNCKELFGYDPQETVDFLSLVGDSSDDIPGFKGIGPKKARKLLDEYGSIEKAIESGYWKDPKEATELWKKNRLLIDLNYFLEFTPLDARNIPMVEKKKPIDIDKFLRICNKYSLNSFKTDLFIKPFEQL